MGVTSFDFFCLQDLAEVLVVDALVALHHSVDIFSSETFISIEVATSILFVIKRPYVKFYLFIHIIVIVSILS